MFQSKVNQPIKASTSLQSWPIGSHEVDYIVGKNIPVNKKKLWETFRQKVSEIPLAAEEKKEEKCVR